MKKVKVNQDLCIRCGFCMGQASDVFQANEQGLSEPKVNEVSDDNKNAILAMEGCPTGAISLEDCDCEDCHCEHCECNHEE